MRDPDQQLQWALRFAQADLSTWRAGDWLNAWDDVLRLVTPSGSEAREGETALALMALVPAYARRGKPRDPAQVKAWLAPLQDALRDMLQRLVKERRAAQTMAPALATEGERPGRFMLPTSIGPFTGEAVLVTQPPFNRLQMYFAPKDPSPEQRFVRGAVLRVADLLTRINLDRLKVCPECGRLFVAVRRQRFDTAQCSLRDRVRRFRQQTRKRARGRRIRRRT